MKSSAKTSVRGMGVKDGEGEGGGDRRRGEDQNLSDKMADFSYFWNNTRKTFLCHD